MRTCWHCVVPVALWVGLCSASTLRAGGGKPIPLSDDEQTDWQALPGGYRALSNRHLIHPVDIGDWPLKLDSTHQLFVDDFLLAERHDLRRELHQPVKHPANPILQPEQPWEKQTGGFIVDLVVRDQKTGRFRMWYTVGPLPNDEMPPQKGGKALYLPTCYAESDDGVRWTKPNVGKYRIGGSTRNNIVHCGNPMGIFLDPREKDPNKRFKGFFNNRPPNVPMGGIYLSTSPDGIEWAEQNAWPIMIRKKGTQHVFYKGYFAPKRGLPAGFTDLNNAAIRYDWRLGKYVADVKVLIRGARCCGMSVSDDCVHWSIPRMVMYMDKKDPKDAQLYFYHAFPYESMWLGFLRVMRTRRTGWKQTEIQLISSRDGITWTRAGDRREFLPLGGDESFDADYNTPALNNKCVPVGDELWIYYMGSRHWKRDHAKPPVWGGYRRAIGLAKLRRDGFVSLGAGKKIGTLLTRPVSYGGRRLFVNAQIEPGGYLRAEVRDFYNKTLAPYRRGDCTALRKGAVCAAIAWEKTDRLPAGANEAINKHIRLLFELKNARLYSFWIE